MSLPVDLTVATTLPGFSKRFARSSISLGDHSTLTFTIDNTLNLSRMGNLDFTDNLSIGMVTANPATHRISAGFPNTSITAIPGTSVITFDANGSNIIAGFEVLPDGATCTVSIDVTATGTGILDNLTNALLADFVSSGKASDTLEVTITPIALQKSFTDDPVPPEGSATLEFMANNFDRNSPASSIEFTDDLTNLVPALADLTFNSLLLNNCGGLVSGARGTSIDFSDGTLEPEGFYTIPVSLSVPGLAIPCIYTSNTDNVTAEIASDGVTGNIASKDLFVESVPLLSMEFTCDPINAGDGAIIRFKITNINTNSGATNIAFTDELATFLSFPVSAVLAGLTATLPATPNPPLFNFNFSPNETNAGDATRLTFIIDNSLYTEPAHLVGFSNNLPSGLIASMPANVSTTWFGDTLNVAVGANSFDYSGGSVAAGSSCTVSVDILVNALGLVTNITSDLLSILGTSSAASGLLSVNTIITVERTPTMQEWALILLSGLLLLVVWRQLCFAS